MNWKRLRCWLRGVRCGFLPTAGHIWSNWRRHRAASGLSYEACECWSCGVTKQRAIVLRGAIDGRDG